MSFSGAKHPGGNGDAGGSNLMSLLIINKIPVPVDITNVQILNGVDDPFITPDLDTGYESYNIGPVPPGSALKGSFDNTNPALQVLITANAAVPTGFNVAAHAYGKTVVHTDSGFPATGGSIDIYVNVDFQNGNPATIILDNITGL